MQGDGFQQASEDPFIDLPDHPRGKVEKADSTLPGSRRPDHHALGFYPQPGITEFEAHANNLMQARRRDGLNAHAFMGEIANDPAIGFIEDDVGQGAQIVPVVGPRLSRGTQSCLHTHRRRIAGRGLIWILCFAAV